MKIMHVTAGCLFIAFLLLGSVASGAETKDLPKIISNALDKYKAEGADHLIPNLLSGSPNEGDLQALSQANMIRQIETFYGKFQNAELFKAVTISQTTSLVYFVMSYEKGPLYGSATVFKHNGKEIIPTFNFHTDIHKIMPSELVFNQ